MSRPIWFLATACRSGPYRPPVEEAGRSV